MLLKDLKGLIRPEELHFGEDSVRKLKIVWLIWTYSGAWLCKELLAELKAMIKVSS